MQPYSFKFERQAAPASIITSSHAKPKAPQPKSHCLYQPSKAAFLLVYRRNLIKFYGHGEIWKNKDMCDKFLARVKITLDTQHRLWATDNVYVQKAYQEITGKKIKPTLADLRALNDGPATVPHTIVLNRFRWQKVFDFAAWLTLIGHNVSVVTSHSQTENVNGKSIQQSDERKTGSAAYIIHRLYEHFLFEHTDYETELSAD